MFSYIDEQNVFNRYRDAKKYTDSLTDPFPEFERIARNRPLDNIDPNYPRTTDGTAASIIRKTPRRIVQQLPTGVVIAEDENDWLPVVAGDILRNKIIPCANDEYDLIQKSQTVVEKSLAFGACGTYAPFLNHDGYLSPDCSVIYWGNLAIPKGKKSGYSLPYVFMESWWQKEDIEALIASQSKLSKKTEKTWAVDKLQQVLEALTEKDQHQQTPNEQDRAVESSGILLVTAFQKGVGAKFITFNPQKNVIVRTKVNKDPRGQMPIDWMYGDIDGTNPLGRSIIELIGGIQNLIDADMQMYQYNRALMLDPPILKRGSMSKNKVRYAVHEVIDLGTDPANDVKPLSVDTSAVVNYPALYGLQKSQLLNLVNSPDTSVSSDVGNPGFSKTDAGVKSQDATISIDDNYLRNMYESWFQHWCETAINLWFAERTGTEEITLDADSVEKLQELAEQGHFDIELLKENKLRINYDDATPALKFRVDASTSKKKDDAEQLNLIKEALTTVTPQVTYYMAQDGWKFGLGEAYRTMLTKLGIANIDKIVTKMSDEEAAQAKQQPFPIIDPPQIRLTGQIPNGAMAAALSNGGVAVPDGLSTMQENIDLGDIIKDPNTTPAEKAQIKKMAGIEPDVNAVANQMTSEDVQHHVTQMGGLGQVSPPAAETQLGADNSQPTQDPSQQPAPQPQQVHPADQQIIEQLKGLGIPDDKIGQALALLHHGYPAKKILQMIGAQHGR